MLDINLKTSNFYSSQDVSQSSTECLRLCTSVKKCNLKNILDFFFHFSNILMFFGCYLSPYQCLEIKDAIFIIVSAFLKV